MTEQLSPAAQAILDAYFSSFHLTPNQSIAAALRAAADQVVPEEPEGGMEPRWIRQSVRHKFLAITAELRGHDD